jgi:hypothetical protein
VTPKEYRNLPLPWKIMSVLRRKLATQ